MHGGFALVFVATPNLPASQAADLHAAWPGSSVYSMPSSQAMHLEDSLAPLALPKRPMPHSRHAVRSPAPVVLDQRPTGHLAQLPYRLLQLQLDILLFRGGSNAMSGGR